MEAILVEDWQVRQGGKRMKIMMMIRSEEEMEVKRW